MSLKKIIREEMDNSLQWIKDVKSYPTLQQLFNKGEIKEGDVLVLRGEVQSDDEGGEITWVNDFTITIISRGERLDTTGFNLDPNEIEVKEAMGLSLYNNITFLESDGNLEVIRKNNQSTQLTESDDLQWIRDVKVNPWDGIEFKVSANKDLKTTYKILDWGDPKRVRVVWRDNDDYHNKWEHTHYTRDEVKKHFNKGNWVIVNENMTESKDGLQWIRDIKTNNDIAQEIYDGLEWYKEPNVSTNFVRPQWNDYNFSVRTSKENKEKVVIHPHSFHIGFKQYLLDNWGIYDVLEKRKIMERIKELMNQKIR